MRALGMMAAAVLLAGCTVKVDEAVRGQDVLEWAGLGGIGRD